MFRVVHALILGLFLTSGSVAQEVIILKGQVLNDTIERASLTVVNLTLKKAAITNTDGYFEIEARLQDTVNISAVHYEPRQFRVTNQMVQDSRVSFYLAPKITELAEVEISNIRLSGNIHEDIKTVALDPYISTVGFGPGGGKRIPTAEERRLYTAQSSSGGIIPFGALINAISGRTKRLKKQLEIAKLQMVMSNTRDRFSDTLYMRNLNIKEAHIEDFVYYALEDPKSKNYLAQEKVFELLEYLQTKAAAYRKMKATEGPSVDPKN